MSYRTDNGASYDRTLLSSVPDPTRAEKQVRGAPQPTLRLILEISKLNMVTIFPCFVLPFPFLSLPIPPISPTSHYPLTPALTYCIHAGFERGVFVQ